MTTLRMKRRGKRVRYASIKEAAEANGIDRHTFWEWVRRGENQDERPQTDAFAKFAKQVREARAEARLSAEGLEIATSTPEQTAAFVKSEIAKWSKLIKELGVKSE